jgi:hypothetical protein
MRILILHEDYDPFLEWFNAEHPGLLEQSYETQRRRRRETLFAGTSIFYEDGLNDLGHTAETVFVNNQNMQLRWASEHGLGFDPETASEPDPSPLFSLATRVASAIPIQFRPYLSRFIDARNQRPGWFHTVLEHQIREFEPDVILNKGLPVSGTFLKDAGQTDVVVAGSVGLPSLLHEDFTGNDIVITHVPGLQAEIESRGYPTGLVRHAFGEAILDTVEPTGSTIPVSFIGSLSPQHGTRIELLEELCRQFPMEIWAPSVDALSGDSPIRNCYQGQAWGREMYDILARSKITINTHIDGVSAAANLRLFEATGMGTLSLTDKKEGLGDLFEPGQEVLSYDSVRDCVDQIEYYLEHSAEREAIAKAGHRRTFADHTFLDRSERLVSLLEEHV